MLDGMVLLSMFRKLLGLANKTFEISTLLKITSDKGNNQYEKFNSRGRRCRTVSWLWF